MILLFFILHAWALVKGPRDLILCVGEENIVALNAASFFRKTTISLNEIASFSIVKKGNFMGVQTEKCLIANLKNGSDKEVVNFWSAIAKVDRAGQEQVIRFLQSQGFRVST
ncbi:MAG: hypothetical protein P9X24_11340 [Candidatus Hatepunaea meridiana]|nr:hypothetical protein [Candidatus Hatepunaea meridiana]